MCCKRSPGHGDFENQPVFGTAKHSRGAAAQFLAAEAAAHAAQARAAQETWALQFFVHLLSGSWKNLLQHRPSWNVIISAFSLGTNSDQQY